MSTKAITIGIDSSSTNCGVAIFIGGKLEKTIAYPFDGPYSVDKLKRITDQFHALFAQYHPTMVILEEPLAVRNGKVTRILNQIAGAILAVALSYGAFVDMIHGQTVKRLLDVHSKEDSLERVKELYGVTCRTHDESDAVLVVAGYELAYV